MKKVFTLIVGLVAIQMIFAQDAIMHPSRLLNLEANSQKPTKGLRLSYAGSRAASTCDTVQLDYTSYYELWTSNLGLTFHGSFTSGDPFPATEVTAFVDTFHSFNNQYIKSVFDTLSYVDVNSQLRFLPLYTTTIKLDSLGMYIGISGDSTKMNNDSLVFTIYKRVGQVETEVKKVVMSGPSWFENFYVEPNFLGYAQIGIDQQFNKGEGFAIRMDYKGKDTSSHCLFAYAYADSCGTVSLGGANYSSPAFTPPFGRISYSGEIRPSGSIATVTAANNLQTYNLPGIPTSCRYVYEQVYDFFPIISACVDFGTQAIPSVTKACPNGTVDLSAAVFGTNSSSVTYNWTATNGTLSANSDETTSLTMGATGSAVVILTVTDGPDSVSDTITITNVGITISITNPSPASVACGGNVTLTTTAGGTTTGRTYVWSNTPPSTSANVTLTAPLPGTYSVTTTNNSGCTASASVAVIYAGGVTNTVNFDRLPATGTICKNDLVTFTNTSTSKDGLWTALWDVVGNNTNYTTTDATHAYTGAGTFPVKLTMDSANCRFTVTKSITISNCVGIDEVDFGQAITLQPNPSNGNITISVEGVENNLSIRVYNIIGTEVKSFIAGDVTSSFSRSFDFSDLSNGTYLVKIQSAEKSAVKRFTVSK